MRNMVASCGVALLVIVAWCACYAGEQATAGWGDYSVEVNEHGNLGRIFLARGFDEIEAMRARMSGVEPNVWKVVLVLVPTLDVTWKGDTGQQRHRVAHLEPEQMENARASLRKTADWVSVFTGGHLRWDMSELVFAEPVVLTMGPEQQGPFFPPPLKDEMIAAFPSWKPDEVDSVICVFPPGDMQLNAFGRSWGQWHGKLKAGNANIAFFDRAIGPDAGMVYVMLHEWLHQAEAVMARNLGYVGLPGLHDLAENGYSQTDLELPSATCWYRDFMFRLFRPAMWQRADMNRESWWRPAPRSPYITQWLVRGPFPNADDTGLDADFLDGEADVVPVAAEPAAFPIEENAAWYAVDTATLCEPLPDNATDAQREERADREQIVDFTLVFKPSVEAVAYAHVYLHALRTEEALLWIGSDSGAKVFFNGLMVHRNRVDRGLARDEDRVPVVLKKGWNRLLVKVDQTEGDWGLCARFTTAKGDSVPGLTTAVELPDGAAVEPGTAVPVEWDGTLYAWDDVKDDPWARLPQLSDEMLRAMTGLDGLRLEAQTGVLRVDPGRSSHVMSPVLARIDTADAALNNQLTYKSESLAWIRYRTTVSDERFTSGHRDLLFVRWDLIDPWVDWLTSSSSVPADRSVAGYVVLARQLAVVIYTDLGEQPPGRELDLVSVEDKGVRATISLKRAVSLTDKIVDAQLRVTNAGAEAITVKRIAAACDNLSAETIVRSPIQNERVGPAGTLSKTVPLVRIVPGAAPGLRLIRVWLDVTTPTGPTRLEKWLAVEVKQPIGVELAVDGPSIVRGGVTRRAHLVLTNNVAHLGKVTWRVAGRGVKARPGSKRFVIRPLPPVTEEELLIRFSKAKRRGTANIVTTVDVAEGTVPDSRHALRVQVGASKALFRHDFERDLCGWQVRTGTYTIEHVQGREMSGKAYALIRDGGGDKYGRLLVFGPERGAESQWRTAYSSNEYPMIDFSVALKDTANVGVLVRADDTWYALVLTGEFVAGKGVDAVIGDLAIEADGTVHAVRFNLDEALDAVAGEGDHAVQQIWLGDRRDGANREPGSNVGTIMIDDFTVR